ncbi:Oidioi.mRNA.OKI2018_I69.PAR.g9118.t1.cds [Oikopleura dioica]|uniref:Oidioi.mRNA.OKI2018_I69.PAR.g9118.t1.cds n=1 Tax=Oikopleura dioica TaxID=34765 RepID=A0ABN7RPY7_OIKDI|nr:Oidioi.mRNA.OKI2018_I69.PAR.g9118.t1.cds [Oikopleura dioica]
MKIFIFLAGAISAFSISEQQANEFLSRDKRSPLGSPCRTDCVDECLQECTENRLEDLYKYNQYRAVQVREYWFNKGHNQ